MRYHVSWHIDFDHSDCIDVLDAAKKALELVRDPDGTAIVFKVIDTQTNRTVLVDLVDDNIAEIPNS